MLSADPITITAVDDERIAFFRLLKGNQPRLRDAGVIIVEGVTQLARLFESSLRVRTLFLEEELYAHFGSQLAKRQGLECFVAARSVMEQIIGYRLHRGALALADRPNFVPLEQLTGPIVALNGLVDPENVGAIMRTCSAFAVPSLLVDSRTCDPYHRRAIRVSMGAAFSLQIAVVINLAVALAQLGRRLRVIGFESGPKARLLDEIDLGPESVLVFGSEGKGISADVLARCSAVLRIPMTELNVSSLNVSAAVAVVLSLLYRKRQNGPAPQP